MSTPTPAMLKGLKKPAEKPVSETTPPAGTSSPKAKSTSKRTNKPGSKKSSVHVDVTPSVTSTSHSQNPPTPPSSGGSASTVRSRRKAKSSKTTSNVSGSGGKTVSTQQPKKPSSTERRLGYRNQPLKGHEGLKALQKEMEKTDPGAITGGRIDFVQTNHVPPHQSYTERKELLRRLEQNLRKDNI